MSINQPYHTWVSRIWQIRPTERSTRVRNMAQLLHGIFERKSVHISEVATADCVDVGPGRAWA